MRCGDQREPSPFKEQLIIDWIVRACLSDTVMRGGGGVGAGGRVNELPKLASSCDFCLASFQLEYLVNALLCRTS